MKEYSILTFHKSLRVMGERKFVLYRSNQLPDCSHASTIIYFDSVVMLHRPVPRSAYQRVDDVINRHYVQIHIRIAYDAPDNAYPTPQHHTCKI